jgi:hypothetical protein
MVGLVYKEWLWRRWPWALALLAGVLFLGLRSQRAAPPRAAAVDAAAIEVSVEVAKVCAGTPGGACSQKDEPASVPIAGASVRLLRGEPASLSVLAATTTDGTGRARLELRPGAQWLEVEAPGRARWSAELPVAQPGAPLHVALAAAVPLHVRVRDDEGRVLAGAQVLAYGDEALPQAAVSDALGEASFANTAEHIDSIRVSAPGHASSSVEPTSRDVSVQVGSAASLLVTVLSPTSPPAPVALGQGAEVWLSGLDVWPPRQSRAEADGNVVWDGLSRGTYDLRAELAGGVAVTSVTLERGEHRAINMELVPGRSVEVQVSDGAGGAKPIAGADVVLVEDGLGPFPLHGRTDAQGRVTLGPLSPGGATVSARAEGFMPESALPVASDARSVQLALTRGGRVRGRVLDSAGQPIAGASLEVLGSDLRGQPIARRAWLDPLAGAGERSLVPPAPLIPLGELGVLPGPLPLPGGAESGAAPRDAWLSDSSGSFRLDDVPPGRIRVLARHPDFVEAASAELELAPAGEVTLAIALQKGAMLSGHVLEPGGRPVARARLEAQARHGLQQTTVLSRDDGSFAFRAVATDVDLFVARPSDRQRFVLRQSFELRPGEERQLELTLPSERAALEVLVLGDDKRPVAGAVVSVLSLDPAAPLRRNLASDATGVVRVADAVGLLLALRVQATGFGSFETQLDAAPERVEVSLEPAVRVTGRVTQVRGRQGLPGASVVWIQGGERRASRSDASGEFQLRDASPGPARVRVSHPGFATHTVELSVPGTGRADRAFELPPINLVEAGSVSGRVIDAAGDPVRGARVGVGLVPAFLPAGGEAFGLVQSDSNGQFSLDEVPLGRVTISAYAAGSGRGSVADVEVRAGETTGPVEIELHGGSSDLGAAALANVAITLGERPGRGGVEVVIVNVAVGSEAERADLREGDVLRAIDGWDVHGMADARGYLGGSDGSDVIVEVDRSGEWLSLNVRREAVRR